LQELNYKLIGQEGQNLVGGIWAWAMDLNYAKPRSFRGFASQSTFLRHRFCRSI